VPMARSALDHSYCDRLKDMGLARKVLWIVNMNTDASEKSFAKHALACAADTVCIQTSSNRLPDAISDFKKLGMSVYAWRWPSSIPTRAMAEANMVAKKLIPAGLDGYIADPESDGPGANDWNKPGLEQLAADFCATIKGGTGKNFRFGVTSGCSYPAPNMKPHIPWKQFFSASDILLPQCYWRWTSPATGKPGKINGGTPAKAIAKGVPAWKAKSLGKPVVPMAGEIDVVLPDEIKEYGQAIEASGVMEGHFYADTGDIPVANLAAIQAL
jgi:hypothetical protein